MVIRILLAIMAIQIAIALGICYAAAAYVPPGFALLLALLAVVLVRMTITANNFRLARRFGSTVPAESRLAPPARLRLFLGEFRATMLTSSWYMLRYRPAPFLAGTTSISDTPLPVLLVHGYGCNGGYWAPLRALLRREGIRHDAVDLEPFTASIDDFIEPVEQGVRRLLAATGAPQVVIVGHSMGGLVARAWLRRHGPDNVARIVTIGTPHHGTALAGFGIGENALQMRRDSAWLAQLNGDDSAFRPVLTSIWSWHDNIIAPQDSCRLPGAKNITFAGIGHVALGSDPRALACVLEEILTATSPSATLNC